MTVMSQDVVVPRNEYPRPQLVRDDWQNLNGEWEFAFDDENIGLTEAWGDGRPLSRRIVVPFAYQTEFSGINDKSVHELVWYARSFTIPREWDGQNILMNFGAVDYEATVWINGREAKHNIGGHVPFSLEISPYLVEGENRVTVRVADRQDATQPRGKQAVSGVPGEIDYYCTTGIWQTVWLEPVPKMRIDDIRITPLFKESAFEIIAYLHAPSTNWRLDVTARDGEEVVSTISKETPRATVRVVLPIPNPKLWSPDNPYLYDLEVKLCQGEVLMDSIRSYAGMRRIRVEGNMLMLNNKPLYLAMVLDQGYWPAGGLTAPSDDDLRADVERTKQLGFNGSRKHQKVEDPRWLYWCDKLGLLVWGEMANAREWSPQAEERLIAEWERAVKRDYNHPCIITWVPMNESWGVPGLREGQSAQYAYLERIVSATRLIDRARPVIDNDGWEHTDITDICAIHDYTSTGEGLKQRYQATLENSELPRTVWLEHVPLYAQDAEYRGQPIVLTEVGGFLMIPPGHAEGNLDVLYKFYGSVKTPEEMLEKYRDLVKGLRELTFIGGFCYTQLVDVEHEINGLLTYDRQPKVPVEEIASLNRSLIEDYAKRFSKVVRDAAWWDRVNLRLKQVAKDRLEKAKKHRLTRNR